MLCAGVMSPVWNIVNMTAGTNLTALAGRQLEWSVKTSQKLWSQRRWTGGLDMSSITVQTWALVGSCRIPLSHCARIRGCPSTTYHQIDFWFGNAVFVRKITGKCAYLIEVSSFYLSLSLLYALTLRSDFTLWYYALALRSDFALWHYAPTLHSDFTLTLPRAEPVSIHT